jgi:CHAD domain-containing protein
LKSGDREDLRRLAAEAILKNLKALAAQIPGVRARRSSAPVHDLRVASRRVRTALRLLDDAAPSKRCRRWNRELKRLASALSRARDTDVQADFLRAFLAKHRDARLRPGIRRLLLRLRERREKQQVKILRELDRFVARGTLSEIRRRFQRIKEHRVIESASSFALRSGPEGYEGRVRTPRDDVGRAILPDRGLIARATHSALRTRLARPILKRLDRMLAHERGIARPERRKELHRMRIAAKHFRYTMEAFAPRYGGRLDPWIRAARRIQTELGEIHDCDVWIHQALPKFLLFCARRSSGAAKSGADARARAALAESKPGIAALLRDRRRRRNAIYSAFLRRWKELRRKSAWEKLRRELS